MFTKQNKTKCLQTSYVYKTNTCLHNKSLTNTLCLQNKTNVYNTNVYKTKVYRHVMFTKQSIQQKVDKTKLKFTNTLCLQNKIKKFTNTLCLQNKNRCLQHKCLQNTTLQTRYVYKTKYKTESIQNKQSSQTRYIYKIKMYRQVQTRYVYKTK